MFQRLFLHLAVNAEHPSQAEPNKPGTLHHNNFHNSFHPFKQRSAAARQGNAQRHNDNGSEKQHQLNRAETGHCQPQPKGHRVHSAAPGKPGASIRTAYLSHWEPPPFLYWYSILYRTGEKCAKKPGLKTARIFGLVQEWRDLRVFTSGSKPKRWMRLRSQPPCK